jgi:ubiquinone/menaquinone biosynthesis C-methylase UbiE
MSSHDLSQNFRLEEERIRSVYAKRERSRYSHFDVAQSLTLFEIETQLMDVLRRNRRIDLSSQKILEVGCGGGYWLRRMMEWGAAPYNVFGVDILKDRIAAARVISPQGTTFRCDSATALGFDDESFDIVSQFTVFSSVLDASVRKRIADEMLRVLKATGLIIWFDYFIGNPRNPDVRGIAKSEIERLFPGSEVSLKRVLLAPPIARAIAPYSRTLYSALSRMPLLCTHYMGAIRRFPAQETRGNAG